ncbi:MAG: hypothetical protein K8I27_01960 [Planctomycetes bacterium]|nr:hypothetical protein [Planctomycetota bacterium]
MSEFSASLDSLWAVQKHDKQLVRERERVAKAARDLAAEQAKVDAGAAKLEQEREKLRLLKKQHKDLEGELQRLDSRVKQLEAQGTEKGTEAAAKQRANIDEMETEGLDLLAQISAQEGEVEKFQEALRLRNEALLAATRTTGEQTRTAEEAIEKATGERHGAAGQVVPELLSVYDEVNARHPGNALCHIEGEFCAGCQGALNSQLTMQVRARREILRCPNCARILDA